MHMQASELGDVIVWTLSHIWLATAIIKKFDVDGRIKAAIGRDGVDFRSVLLTPASVSASDSTSALALLSPEHAHSVVYDPFATLSLEICEGSLFFDCPISITFCFCCWLALP